MDIVEEKPIVSTDVTKSSAEILNELFSTFDAEPPLIIKKEDYSKISKKSKKKHKHKDKKHKKKLRKRKRNLSNSSSSSDEDLEKHNLIDVILKEEKDLSGKKIKIEKDTDTIIENSNIDVIKVEDSENNPCENKVINQPNEYSKKDLPPSENCESTVKIPNIKFGKIFTQTILEIQKKQENDPICKNVGLSEESELSEGEVREPKKHKHKKKHKEKHRSEKEKRSNCSSSRHYSHDRDEIIESLKGKKHEDFYSKYNRFEEKRRDKFRDDYKDFLKDDCKDRLRDDFKDQTRDYYSDRFRSSYRDRYKDNYKDKYKEDLRHKIDEKKHNKNSRNEYSRNENKDENKRCYSDRTKDRSSDREFIDKKKLLEIARKNAIQMMRSGNLPGALTLGQQAQEKVLAAIRSGGKTIEELTEFCKTLSKKEELGELSSISEGENDSDNEKPFNHPFQLKDRPSSIVMNIKNAIPLPLKTSQERSSELRMQFPVSSGQQHRKTEGGWVPVSPQKSKSPAPPSSVTPSIVDTKVATQIPKEVHTQPLAIMPPPGPQVFPSIVDIGTVVSQRLSAIRKLQENPNDVQAINEIYKSQKEMQNWAESKQQPGQFTGSTGAQILSQAELSSGHQAWAKKDQLQTAAPVSGGMGMHLLQKMGWKPGEGLGKEKSGTLEPLLLEVKLDKKGLVANEEQRKKQAVKAKATQKLIVTTLEGKHPVSLLGEYAAKKKLGPPVYEICDENGPDHKKTFLFKVILNGIEYKPDAPNFNKKQAKKDAAEYCLKHLGLF